MRLLYGVAWRYLLSSVGILFPRHNCRHRLGKGDDGRLKVKNYLWEQGPLPV